MHNGRGSETCAIIDVTRLVERFLHRKISTGVDRVGLAYIDHFRDGALALIRFAGRWVVLRPRASQRLFDVLLLPGRYSAFMLRWLVAVHYVFDWRRHDGALLLNVMHSGLENPAYAMRLSRRKWRPFFFLHDLIPLTHPEYCRPGEADKHRMRLAAMLSTGKAIVVNSGQTGQEIADYARDHHLPLPPVLCALLPPTRLPLATGPAPIDGVYFVVVCTIEPRKNHLLLLNIWRELAQELGSAAPRLVLIGKRGWECEQVEDMLDRCESLKGLAIERSQCRDIELSDWIAGACALLFPSFAEGFGMPVIEALSAGIPVIASNLPVFREIAGNIPEYVSPLDAVSWKRLILDYAAPESATRRAQCERLHSYRIPDEGAYFAQVKEFLRGLGEYH